MKSAPQIQPITRPAAAVADAAAEFNQMIEDHAEGLTFGPTYNRKLRDEMDGARDAIARLACPRSARTWLGNCRAIIAL